MASWLQFLNYPIIGEQSIENSVFCLGIIISLFPIERKL